MNKLIQVSQILYEREIVEKNKEIAILKHKLKELETPTVIHESFSDWEQKKYSAFKMIEKSISQAITDNHNEFKIMLQNKTMLQILTGNQELIITTAIKNALIIMTSNATWSHKKANDLIVQIQAFLSGYKITHSMNETNKIEIGRMIQQFIKYQFERAESSFAFSNLIITNSNSIYNSRWADSTKGLFIEIARFKCILCGNICNIAEIDPNFTCRKQCCEDID